MKKEFNKEELKVILALVNTARENIDEYINDDFMEEAEVRNEAHLQDLLTNILCDTTID